MKRCLSVLCVGSLIAAASISAETIVNASDATVYAPSLSGAQEATFSVTDDKISSFWDSWDDYDYAYLTPEAHAHIQRDGFDGIEDAQLELKVASGSQGFYLYCKVTDDTWTAAPSEGQFAYDAVDILFDLKTAAEIAISDPGHSEMPNWGVTTTSQQYQLYMGEADKLPTTMIFNAINEIGAFDFGIERTFETMASQYGVKVQIIKINSTTKIMEWFVPWTHLGITDQTIPEGRRIGFCAGYNDMDASTGGVEAALRLKGNGDPISGGVETTPPEPFSARVLYWGEIVFASSVSTELRSALVLRNKANMGEIASSDFFTLQGEKIAATNISQIKNHSIVVQRSVLKDGSVVSARVPLGR